MNRTDFTTGKIYFLVTYLDQELLVPNIESLFYLDSEKLNTSNDGLYFQAAEFFFETGPYKEGSLEEQGVIFINDDSLDCVHDYESLQQEIEYMKKGGARFYP